MRFISTLLTDLQTFSVIRRTTVYFVDFESVCFFTCNDSLSRTLLAAGPGCGAAWHVLLLGSRRRQFFPMSVALNQIGSSRAQWIAFRPFLSIHLWHMRAHTVLHYTNYQKPTGWPLQTFLFYFRECFAFGCILLIMSLIICAGATQSGGQYTGEVAWTQAWTSGRR